MADKCCLNVWRGICWIVMFPECYQTCQPTFWGEVAAACLSTDWLTQVIAHELLWLMCLWNCKCIVLWLAGTTVPNITRFLSHSWYLWWSSGCDRKSLSSFSLQLKWRPDGEEKEWRATAASITYPPLMHDWKASASLEDCIIYIRLLQKSRGKQQL